jgi:hypothetical protein
MAVHDDTAYLSVAGKGLQIYDIAATPVKVGEYVITPFTQPGSLLLRDSFLYLSGNGGIRVFDVADPTSPTLAGTCPAAQSGYLVSQGNLLIDARTGESGQLRILRLDHPTSPTTAAIYPMDFVGEVAIRDHWLFVAGETGNDIRVIDIADPTSPTQRAVFTHPNLHFPTSLDLSGDKLLFTGDSGPMNFGILDVSNPLHPTLLGGVNEPALAESGWVRVHGEYAYLLDSLGSAITIYHIADPCDPRKIHQSNLDLGSWAHGLLVNEQNLYVYGDQGVRFFYYTVPVTLTRFSLE